MFQNGGEADFDTDGGNHDESSANDMKSVMSKQQERRFLDKVREANGVGLKVRIGTHNALQPAHGGSVALLLSNSVVPPPPSS